MERIVRVTLANAVFETSIETDNFPTRNRELICDILKGLDLVCAPEELSMDDDWELGHIEVHHKAEVSLPLLKKKQNLILLHLVVNYPQPGPITENSSEK